MDTSASGPDTIVLIDGFWVTPRSRPLPARDGWEDIADYALSWAVNHARPAGAGSAPA
jgi:hypothetical protein